MKTTSQALRTARLFAALIPLTAALLAADPAPQAAPTPTPETALHEIGAAPVAPAAPAAIPAPTLVPSPTADPDDDDNSRPLVSTHFHEKNDGDNNRVAVGESVTVGRDETVGGNAVSVMGPLKVLGTVDGNAVAVLGSSRIDGTVHGNAVVVLGTLHLGSHAHIDGNCVAGVGAVTKEPGAYIGGHIVNTGVGMDGEDDNAASSLWTHGLRLGRPLAFGHHLHVVWILNAILIGLYMLLALAFPGGTSKCAATLTQRPGATFLVGVLSIIALPVLFVLLCITIVGIPVAIIVLPLAIMVCIAFGKASIYRLLGSALVGKDQHPALAVLVGALVVVAIYLVPVMGILVWIVVAFLGFACVVTTLLAPVKAAVAVTVPIPVAVPPVMDASAQPPVVPAEAAPAAALAVPLAVESAPLPPPLVQAAPLVPEAALPRARFWPRMMALLIDAILIGVITQMSDFVLPALAIYGALLWKFKGATIGGIIFGIKVVRLDGRPVDWPTAIVRALACFISLIAVGLGFIWIAFDVERQGWHDKIAGTVVVKLPKGTSLV
ncbi:MAG TPA: RDD family protein [Opitutaceae bacterium]